MDIIGDKYGEWTVLEFSHKENKEYFYKCKCSCGEIKTVNKKTLISGKSTKCSKCATKDRIKKMAHELTEQEKNKFGTDKVFPSRFKNKKAKSSTGVIGVYEDKGKYQASISFAGKNIYLGRFDTIEEAKEAREIAEKEYYKPFL